MKHLKTTIKLSVLALACLGAGALALQPAAYAQAEDTNPADCLTMVNGAAVSVKDSFSGIRWETKIDSAKYEALKAANEGKEITFGTLVMPTSLLGDAVLDENDISENADEGALDLPAHVDYADLPAAFYSVVNYDEIAENTAAAYALELTARSYVKIDDAYYFVDLGTTDTSRSARQVALSADLDGELDGMTSEKAAKAIGYYGYTGVGYTPEEVSNGAAGTAFIDLNNGATPEQTVVVKDFTLPDDVDVAEAIVGAEKVAAAYDATEKTLTLTIAEGQNFATGEKYVAVFATNGLVYTKPIIGATMVITVAKDLEIFNAKGGYYTCSTKATSWDDGDYWRPEQEQSGYYVLGSNIDATGYVHGSKIAEDVATIAPTVVAGKDKELGTDDDVKPGDFNNSTWNGVASYKNQPIGLTGTFNGLGYSINNMEIGSEREGLFGIVNGGTVKNVGFIDVQATGSYKFVVANYLYKAKVENVYIKTDEYVADADSDGVAESMGFPMENSAGLSNYAAGTTSLKSIFIHYAATNKAGYNTGVMFNGYNASFTCEDVYAVSVNTCNGKAIGSGYTHTLMYLSAQDPASENYKSNKKVWLAENEGTTTLYNDANHTKEVKILADLDADGNPTSKPANAAYNVDKGIFLKLHNDNTDTGKHRPRVVMMGAYRYDSLEKLVTYNETYKNLANTGCWYLDANNYLVWGQPSA